MTEGRHITTALRGLVIAALAFSLVLTAIAPFPRQVRADPIELAYDDGVSVGEVTYACPACRKYQAVLFSLPAGVVSAAVTEVRFYMELGSKSSTTVTINLMQGPNYLSTPVDYVATGTGWHKVPLPDTTVRGDFIVAIGVGKGNLGYDRRNDYGRSYHGEHEKDLIYKFGKGDIMIRAVILAELHVGADQPYKTIQSAVDAAAPGLSVVVHSGTYVENVVVPKSLKVRSKDGPSTTTVRAANGRSDVFKVTTGGVNISGLTVQGATATERAGILLENADGCSILNNRLSDNYYGIRMLSSDSSVLGNNALFGNENAILIEGANNEVTGNEIYNNTGSAGSAIALAAGASGNVIHFNTITANASRESGSLAIFNTNSAEVVNATNNWWGNAGGPYHSMVNPSGTGDVIGDFVEVGPWLGAAPVAVKSAASSAGTYAIDARTEASTMVITTGTGTPMVWAAVYSGNPAGVLPTSGIGKWIDVLLNDTGGVTGVEIRLYYQPEQVTGLNEGSLRLYWWDGSEWVVCKKSGVNKAEGYVWASITDKTAPQISNLRGTPFTAGTTSGGGFQWWLLPVGIVLLVVLMIAVRLVLRLRSRGTDYE